jgi:hypothetical protein
MFRTYIAFAARRNQLVFRACFQREELLHALSSTPTTTLENVTFVYPTSICPGIAVLLDIFEISYTEPKSLR